MQNSAERPDEEDQDDTTPESPIEDGSTWTYEALLLAIQDAEGRRRKQLLPHLLAKAPRDAAPALAPLLRDKSPRVAARVTAWLARVNATAAFESALQGLPEGKVALLRSAFTRQRRSP